jgi:hypothetical protein
MPFYAAEKYRTNKQGNLVRDGNLVSGIEADSTDSAAKAACPDEELFREGTSASLRLIMYEQGLDKAKIRIYTQYYVKPA